MNRLGPILGSIVFLFVAPGIVAGVIPWAISQYRMDVPLLAFEPLRWIGGVLLLLGAVLLLETFARFALQGLGTPAPIAPTKTLVVTGSYRFVRNPMYVAVVSLIFGQGLWFGNWGVMAYGLVVWLTVHLFDANIRHCLPLCSIAIAHRLCGIHRRQKSRCPLRSDTRPTRGTTQPARCRPLGHPSTPWVLAKSASQPRLGRSTSRWDRSFRSSATTRSAAIRTPGPPATIIIGMAADMAAA